MNVFKDFVLKAIPYATTAATIYQVGYQVANWFDSGDNDELDKAKNTDDPEEQKKRLEKLEKKHEEEMKKMQDQFERQLDEKLQEKEKKYKKQLVEQFSKMARVTNYERNYPMPAKLLKHCRNHPNAFRIQILGTRGAGKSFLINKIMKVRECN